MQIENTSVISRSLGLGRVWLQRRNMRGILLAVALLGNLSVMVLTWWYTVVTTHKTVPSKKWILWYVTLKINLKKITTWSKWSKLPTYWQLIISPNVDDVDQAQWNEDTVDHLNPTMQWTTVASGLLISNSYFLRMPGDRKVLPSKNSINCGTVWENNYNNKLFPSPYDVEIMCYGIQEVSRQSPCPSDLQEKIRNDFINTR